MFLEQRANSMGHCAGLVAAARGCARCGRKALDAERLTLMSGRCSTAHNTRVTCVPATPLRPRRLRLPLGGPPAAVQPLATRDTARYPYIRRRRIKSRSFALAFAGTGSGLKCMTSFRTSRNSSSRPMKDGLSRGQPSSAHRDGFSRIRW